MTTTKPVLHAIPLGGAAEVGRNMWVIEVGDEIVVLDCGVMFPEEDMPGVDLVLPDITWLRERRDRITGILLTHGHEDHVGAIAYVLPELGFPPVYGTPLTLGLVTNRLREHRLLDKATLITITEGVSFELGTWTIEPFHIAHSIPDAVGFGLTTPAGLLVYLTDWKFDHAPVDGKPTDINAITELGKRKPLALLTDCVRVETPGYTPSETTVGHAFDEIFATAEGRVIVATFASNLSRVQQVIDSAEAYGRKVALAGRSMENNCKVAFELGYLRAEPGTIIRINEIGNYKDDQLAIACTGSQGEPMAVLNRLANRDYQHVKIKEGDTVIVSATPIPGNEVSVSRVISNLFRLGADVVFGGDGSGTRVHVSGHAAQEELKMLLALLRPMYVVPFHGDYRHLSLYRKLALGMTDLFTPERVLIADNGDVLEFTPRRARVVEKLPVGYVYVDGTSVGETGDVALRDRRMLSQDGILIVVMSIAETGELMAGPDVVGRGFAAVYQGTDLVAGIKDRIHDAFATGKITMPHTDITFVNRKIRDIVGEYVYREAKRRPMIMPIIMEV